MDSQPPQPQPKWTNRRLCDSLRTAKNAEPAEDGDAGPCNFQKRLDDDNYDDDFQDLIEATIPDNMRAQLEGSSFLVGEFSRIFDLVNTAADTAVLDTISNCKGAAVFLSHSKSFALHFTRSIHKVGAACIFRSENMLPTHSVFRSSADA